MATAAAVGGHVTERQRAVDHQARPRITGRWRADGPGECRSSTDTHVVCRAKEGMRHWGACGGGRQAGGGADQQAR